MKLILSSIAAGLLGSAHASSPKIEEWGNEICEVTERQVPVQCPVVPPPKLPKTCSGMSASWWGDPHFTTFNKLKYDCMGEGEFDIVRSSTKPDFALQGRFQKANPRRRPTVTRAIAFQTGDGEPLIQVNVPENPKNGCNPYVFVDGKKTTLQAGQVIQGANNTAIHVQETRSKQGKGYVFYYEESEVQLQVWGKGSSVNGCVLATDICIPDCMLHNGDKFMGMLGTPDDDKKDEWHRRNGDVVPFKGRNAKAEYEYCVKNWCLEDEKQSLFTYEGGKKFADYDQCKLGPYEESKDCAVDMEKLKKICGADNRECIVDGCAQGEAAAKQAVTTALEMVDRNCGKEIFFENFDQGYNASSFGGVVRHKQASKQNGDMEETDYLNLNQAAPEVDWEWKAEGAKMVELEFLFHEIGSWDDGSVRGAAQDKFLMNVCNVDIDIGKLNGRKRDAAREGVVEGIAWSLHPMSLSADLGFGIGQKVAPTCAKAWKQCGGRHPKTNKPWTGPKCCTRGNYCDRQSAHWHMCKPKKGAKGPAAVRQAQTYKVKVSVPAEALIDGDKFQLGLSVAMSSDMTDESAGIDDLRLTAYHDRCSFDCEGTTVVSESFDEEESEKDAASWGRTKELPGGNVILGPLFDDSQPISKTFEVSELAGLAEVEFLLYEMGDWSTAPSNKFLVSIGGTQFDLGPFVDGEVDEADDGSTAMPLFQDSVGGDGGIMWQRKEMEAGGQTTEEGNAKIHKVSVRVPNELFPEGYLTIGFEVESNDPTAISAGIDEFKIRLSNPEKCANVLAEDMDKKCLSKPGPEQPKECYREEKERTCKPKQKTGETTDPPKTPSPTTDAPTTSPTEAATTLAPTASPTETATTLSPTEAATTLAPTATPTEAATTLVPTISPTEAATTLAPTATPTDAATTLSPTASPTETATTLSPTTTPTEAATTLSPTFSPSESATTLSPTAPPTEEATTLAPTNSPTEAATTLSPTASPTETATTLPPTATPTEAATTLAPTPVETTEPPRPKKGSGSGDPHFKTWTGEKYDYHGECDLVLVDNPSFADGLGLKVHIRTTRIKYFSFIEKVALQIGSEVLEFSNDVDNFLINGQTVDADRKHHKTTLAGYHVRRDKKAISVRLDEKAKAKIDLIVRKNGFPAVIVDGGATDIFSGSLGLLGDWSTGKKLARDGMTELQVNGVEDLAGSTAFALEWQVQDHEPMLFNEARFPQYPITCTPPAKRPGSRLGSMRLEAEEACAHWQEDKEDCIFDVMATRDVLVAVEGHVARIE